MTIKQKSVLAVFFVLTLSIAILVLVAVPMQKSIMERLIITSTNSFVQKQLDFVGLLVQYRVDYVVDHSHILNTSPILLNSNNEFDKLSNVQEILDTGDISWRGDESPLIKSVMDNVLSSELILHFKDVGTPVQGTYPNIFSEVFVSNKYGAVVAASNKITDYNQSDEQWWQEAKESGLYIGDVAFDESSNSYSLTIATKIVDSDGDFLGVLKAFLSMDTLFETLRNYDIVDNDYPSRDIILLDSKQNIIFPREYEDNSVVKTFLSTVDLSNGAASTDTLRSPCVEEHEESCIYSHGHLIKFKNLEWTLVVSHEEDILLSSLKEFRNVVVIMTSSLIIFSLLLFMTLLLGITDRLFDLLSVIQKVSFGDTSARVIVGNSKDELGKLSSGINTMLDSIMRSKVLENTILQHIHYGVAIISPLGVISFANEALCNMLGQTTDIIGIKYEQVLKFSNIIEPEIYVSDEFITDVLNKITSATKKDIYLVNKLGTSIPIECSVASIVDKDSSIIGGVIIIKDITEERRIDRAKSDFVSIASHQLRTPLASIRWYAEALLNGVGGIKKPTAGQKDYIEVIYDSTIRIINLVNSLLNVSRLEVGTFAVEPKETVLKEVMSEVLEGMKPMVEQKSLSINKICDPKVPNVMMDREIVGIIFQNIVSNAVKYTRQNGKIEIAGTFVTDPNILAKIKNYKGKTGILVTVKDDGLGIPLKQQVEVFSKLFRADNVRTLTESGTGLGLYTTKLIMDSIGGAVWFESEENKGTTFYILFPEGGMKERESSKKLQFVE